MQVPNGVHIESLKSGGGWREEELGAMRCRLNSLCLQTLPDMVRRILDTFREEEEKEE